jgi:hypothetical protein
MSKPINLKRGERLQILATARDTAGDVIDLTDGYDVACETVARNARVDLEPTITNDGKMKIDYDTFTMPVGDYRLDIRISKDDDQFTDQFTLVIREPITPPTPR